MRKAKGDEGYMLLWDHTQQPFFVQAFNDETGKAYPDYINYPTARLYANGEKVMVPWTEETLLAFLEKRVHPWLKETRGGSWHFTLKAIEVHHGPLKG